MIPLSIGLGHIVKTLNLVYAIERIKELENEVAVLRQFGNKDCTDMADEELNSQRKSDNESSQRITGKSV